MPSFLLRVLCAGVLLATGLPSYASSDVYVCIKPDGLKQYYGSAQKGLSCKRVDLEGVTMQPKKPAAKKPLAIGMKPDEVRHAWGKPAKVRKTTTALGTTEVWSYAGGNAVEFKQGVVTTINH